MSGIAAFTVFEMSRKGEGEQGSDLYMAYSSTSRYGCMSNYFHVFLFSPEILT